VKAGNFHAAGLAVQAGHGGRSRPVAAVRIEGLAVVRAWAGAVGLCLLARPWGFPGPVGGAGRPAHGCGGPAPLPPSAHAHQCIQVGAENFEKS